MPRKKTVEQTESVTKVEEIIEPAGPGEADVKAEKATKKETNGIKVTVIPDRLNIRKRPDAYAPVIDILDKGTELIVEQFDPDKEWTAVKHDSIDGFAMTRFLRA